MPRYEFKLVVTDVELTEDHQEAISKAVAEAGTLALADAAPPEALTFRYNSRVYWRGMPTHLLLDAMMADVATKVGEDSVTIVNR